MFCDNIMIRLDYFVDLYFKQILKGDKSEQSDSEEEKASVEAQVMVDGRNFNEYWQNLQKTKEYNPVVVEYFSKL